MTCRAVLTFFFEMRTLDKYEILIRTYIMQKYLLGMLLTTVEISHQH